MDKTRQITKNDYYKMPIWFLMAIESQMAKNSKYKCNKEDLKKGYYLEVKYLIFSVKIPFRALFHTNSKIKGIKGLDFNNATYCKSYLNGTCQICNKNLCYAFVFEKQYMKSIRNNKGSSKGFLKFNAYYKGFLLVECFKILYSNKDKYALFLEYIDKKIKTLRFNVNSDFNNSNDFNLILDIVKNCNTIVYGYTAFDDLLKGYDDSIYDNLYINGSNKMYTNRFKVTFSLLEYFKANYKCFGACNKCAKCFSLKNKVIMALFHHSKADSILNTYENRLFIVKLLNAFNVNIKIEDLMVYKGIFKSLEAFLIKNDYIDLSDYDITNIKDFLDYIYYLPKIDIEDEINQYGANKEVLEELGLI